MPAPNEDPSGYQRLIVNEATHLHRWLLATCSLIIISLMLFYDRWSVYLWSGLLILHLVYRLVRRHLGERALGYHLIAQRDRHAIAETLIALTVITAFVVVQSRLGLWFSQDPFCPRWYGRCG